MSENLSRTEIAFAHPHVAVKIERLAER